MFQLHPVLIQLNQSSLIFHFLVSESYLASLMSVKNILENYCRCVGVVHIKDVTET